MLYKVCMAETFAEEPDRVGVIQADTMVEAVLKLRLWVDASEWGDYSRVGDPIVKLLGTHALLKYESRDQEFDCSGADEFIVTPISEEPFMFLIEDWPYVFNRLERHL